MFKPWSIKEKMSLAAAVLAVLLGVIIAAFIIPAYKNEQKKIIEDQQFALVSVLADEISQKLTVSHNALMRVAQNIPESYFKDPMKLQRYIELNQALYALFHNILIYSDKGIVLAANPDFTRYRGTDLSRLAYVQKTLNYGNPVVSKPFTSPVSKEPLIVMTAPIIGKDGKILGFIGGSQYFLKKNLLGNLLKAKLGQTGYFYVSTRDRRVLAHPIKSYILKIIDPKGSNPIYDAAIDGFEGVREGKSDSSGHALFSMKALNFSDWLLTGVLPADEAFLPIRKATNRLILITACTAVFAGFIVWVIMQFLLSPLSLLHKHIRAYADNPNIQGEIDLKRKDEIGKLAATFNEMSRNLSKSRKELEKANRDLLQSKAQLHNAIEIAQLGHWEYDVADDIFTFNDQFYKIFRTSVEKVGGYSLSSAEYARRFVHPDDRDRVEEETRKAVETSDPDFSRQLEYRILYVDGNVGYVTVRYFVDKDDHGKTVRTFGVNQDITERKRIDELLIESKRISEGLISTMQDGFTELDVEGHHISVNDAFCQMTGFSKEDLIGTGTPHPYWPPEEKEQIEQAFNETLGKIFDSFELVFMRKNGERFPVIVSPSCLEDKNDNVIRYFATIKDMTRYKQSEDALRESEEKFRLLFENSVDAHVLYQGDQFIDCNFASIKMLGLSGKEALLRLHPSEISPPYQKDGQPSREKADAMVALTFEKGSHRFEWLGQKADGSDLMLDVLLTVIKVKGENLIHGVWRDITDLRALEEKLRQAHKMEAVGTLAGGIAHEFNNVLAIILGNAELALDDVPDWNPAKASLKEIRTACFRAKEVVRQILSFARKSITALKPLEINAIVKESLKLMRASIPAMVDIQPNIPSDPSMILGDPTEIHQIVINLCTNAAHAMKTSGGILEVGISEVTLDEITASRYEDLSAGDFVILTVEDSGEGISPVVLEKVFEPYFTTKEFGAGSGMGLAVVYGIVKKCKGAIKITSAVGEGTTVEVLFPRIDEEAPAEKKKEGELPKGNERILLVDDDPSIVNMIKLMLERIGYAVTSMTESPEALEHFKSTPNDFDLVITDMAMPNMSGDQLAAELIKVRKDLPILLCTGHSDTLDEKEAKEIGIKGFAMKPLDKGRLARAVRSALDGR